MPTDDFWVDAAPFRAHLQRLVEHSGLPVPVVALAAGIEPATARRVATPQPRHRDRMRCQDARALLATTPEQLDGLPRRQVRSAPARRLVTRMRAGGASSAWIAQQAGVDRLVVEQLRAGAVEWVSELTQLRLHALDEQLARARHRAAGRPPARIPAMSTPRPDAA